MHKLSRKSAQSWNGLTFRPTCAYPCFFLQVLCHWCPFIFLIYHYINLYVCVPHLYDISYWLDVGPSVSIRRIIYKYLNTSPFDYTTGTLSGKVERSIVNRFDPTNWVAVVTPTDRPKSVRNRCVLEVFDDVFVLSHCFLMFCGCRGFCHRTESDIFVFFYSW